MKALSRKSWCKETAGVVRDVGERESDVNWKHGSIDHERRIIEHEKHVVRMSKRRKLLSF